MQCPVNMAALKQVHCFFWFQNSEMSLFIHIFFFFLQLKLPQSVSSQQLKRLQSAQFRAGQPVDQWLQVCAPYTTLVNVETSL